MKEIIKISVKILLMLMFFIIIFYTFNNSFVYAEDFNADDWNPKTKYGTSEKRGVSGESKIKNVGNKIIGPIRVIGSLVSVAAIIIIGIKYMLGSVEEKAQYKEILGPYFLGAVLVFGITNVLSIIYNMVSSYS